MAHNFRIGVLASTRGTDLQAIIDEIRTGRLHVELTCVVSNVSDCYALERARAAGFEAIFLNPAGKLKAQYDRELVEIFKKRNVDLVVLVGYMRILTPDFVMAFPRRIINIHPALLPKYGGKGFFGKKVHEAVLKAGEKETGCTVHFVDEGVDTGEIILQKKVTVEAGDTSETLKIKVQNLEKEWYPKAIEYLATALPSQGLSP